MTRDQYFDALEVDEPLVPGPMGPFELHPVPQFEFVDDFIEEEISQYENGVLVSVVKKTRPTRTPIQIGVIWMMQ